MAKKNNIIPKTSTLSAKKSPVKKTAKKSWFLKWLLITIGLGACLAIGFYYMVASGWVGDVPTEKQLRQIQNYTASEIYSADGALLGKYFIQDRTNVRYEEISQYMIDALVATEDARFYTHTGIDKIGMLRVLFKSILMGNDNAGGGSTLSQQLVKNIFPRKKYYMLSMPINKLKEAITAQRLEEIFSKKEILALYLNTVAFGENAFGVGSAARRYFNTTAKKLAIDQAALLVGMLKATNTYNPRKNSEKALTRRNVVISQMLKYKYITEQEANTAKAKPIKLNFKAVSHSDGLAPYFREHLRLELQAWCDSNTKPDGSKYNLYTDGLKIYTTIDSRMQKYAEQAVVEHMSTLQRLFNTHWAKQNPWGNSKAVVTAAIHRSDRYKELKAGGLSEKEIVKLFAVKSEMTLFAYSGEQQRTISSLDSIKYYLRFLSAGFVAIDPNNGHVKAWVGGINHKYFQYDHVNEQTKRQAGSTFKPIVYAAALNVGVSPCEHFANEKQVFTNYNNWSPSNADGLYGGYYSMKGALTHSVNTISAQLIIRAGIDNVIALSKSMGIVSDLEPIPSLALGSADVSLIEMVAAYSVFAHRGLYTKPNYLATIKNASEQVIYKPTAAAHTTRRAISTNNSDIMVKMMQNVVLEGTASRLRTQYGLLNDIAGKTGTTQAQADGWFIGFTPALVAGAWVGGEDRRIRFRSLELGQGASMALPIWGKFFSKLSCDPELKKYVQRTFPALPPDIATTLNCEDHIIPRDSMTFMQKIFGPKPNKSKQEMPPSVKQKSPKYQDTWSKIRNMFKRKKE